MKVLVLGGNGFIGRNIVEKLQVLSFGEKSAKYPKSEQVVNSTQIAKSAQIVQAAQSIQVVIGSRKSTITNTQLQIAMQNFQHASDWLPILKSFDVVVNSVGILRMRKGESYANVHTFAVESLADACAALNIKLIHISAIGLSAKAKSGFITSKYWGEQAILASGANAVIVRASLLDGAGGYGAKWFRRVANWPLQLVMQTKGQVAPLQVTDLGEAVANLIVQNIATPSVIELGGSETVSIAAYLQLLRKRSGQNRALQLAMPKWLVRIASHMFDVFALTPLSFGHFELMQGYNAPVTNYLPMLLNRPPALVGVDSQAMAGRINENKVNSRCLKPNLII